LYPGCRNDLAQRCVASCRQSLVRLLRQVAACRLYRLPSSYDCVSLIPAHRAIGLFGPCAAVHLMTPCRFNVSRQLAVSTRWFSTSSATACQPNAYSCHAGMLSTVGIVGRYALGLSSAAQSTCGLTYTIRSFPKLAHDASVRQASTDSRIRIFLPPGRSGLSFRLARVRCLAGNVCCLYGYNVTPCRFPQRTHLALCFLRSLLGGIGTKAGVSEIPTEKQAADDGRHPQHGKDAGSPTA